MIENQNIVITGTSRRLGLFLCENFSARNSKIFAITRNPSEKLNHLAETAGLEIVEVESYDVENTQNAIASICDKVRKIHALVHNVSAFEGDDERYSDDKYALFYRLHMALPAQLNIGFKDLLYDEKSPGNIVHITDIFAENPSAEHVLYCSTKAGSENLSKGFAKKFAPGVRVNAIQPGPINFLPSHNEKVKEKVLSETLLQREGGFLPIFQAICSIIENSYMTGASIKVDGGRALGGR